MPNIQVLPKNIAELIAAGEVVERPASVIKELVENAIDAGATSITVEIKRGGITYMRVTDNGCGIAKEQIRTAFLRHATSKVSAAEDLNAILTLGFRGEALASVCAVARVEMMTATASSESGACYTIEGGEEQALEEIGCPQGTTVIVRDLFYNVPARMKFLKKDVTEGSAVAAIIDRLALSHPEISFRFIRDEKQVLTTSGDGQQRSAIYAVLGRDYTSSLLPIPLLEGSVAVNGFICKPTACRPNRNGQFFFINGRFVKSGTVSAALDQAYKNSAMIGKFPAAVLNIQLDPQRIDVNVHPTKTEVRFTEERAVFEAVYRAVKAALLAGDTRPEIKLQPKKAGFSSAKENHFYQASVNLEKIPNQNSGSAPSVLTFQDDSKISVSQLAPGSYRLLEVEPHRPQGAVNIDISVEEPLSSANSAVAPSMQQNISSDKPAAPPASAPAPLTSNLPQAAKPLQEPVLTSQSSALNNLRYVGQAFDTYILVSLENTLYFIDKHAAHERMNFERLQALHHVHSQLLLTPLAVDVMPQEHAALLEQQTNLSTYGIELEDFGDHTVVVRAVPTELADGDVSTFIREIAGNILQNGNCESERTTAILHSIACKAAIKAGDRTSVEEQLALARHVLQNKELMYCPHGRPIAFKLTKQELEKQFGRLV